MSLDVNGVKMVGVSGQRPGRYHHGDLRNALVNAAVAQAREGGPDAVVLREAARRVGVSAAAAYHHFGGRDELVEAVKQRSLGLLTEQMHRAIGEENAPAVGPAGAAGPAGATDQAGAAAVARRRLRALGAAYLRFAAAEPGLFRLSFSPRGRWPGAGPATSAEPDGAAGPAEPQHAATGPFRLLSRAIDELAAAGAVPAARRPGLEYVLWAAVHGVAVLCLDGPLASAGPGQCEQIAERALDTIIRGL